VAVFAAHLPFQAVAVGITPSYILLGANITTAEVPRRKEDNDQRFEAAETFQFNSAVNLICRWFQNLLFPFRFFAPPRVNQV
jgi:hypothetical protein